ncbi:MAG: FIST C-terminal domain-containing protein [Bacillota bacterium]|nr:FIST C-terminal domain-containing protein [Bacillota bacterium]
MRFIGFTDDNSTEMLDQLLTNLSSDKEVKAIIMLMAENCSYTYLEMQPQLQGCSVPVYGAIFPSIIYQYKNYNKGIVAIGVTEDIHVKEIRFADMNLEDQLYDFRNKCQGASSKNESNLMMVLLDGFSENGAKFTSQLFSVFHTSTKYIGGGAGGRSCKQFPCVFSADAIWQEGGLLIYARRDSSFGIEHGWVPLYGPLIASAVKGKLLCSLSWKNALAVYKSIIWKTKQIEVNHDNFFDIGNTFPLGVWNINQQYAIRDIIGLEKNNIRLAAPIQQDEVLSIMTGSVFSLVKAAAKAAVNAVNNRPAESSFSLALIIDCASREMFLKEHFARELNAIEKELSKYDYPSIGALTIGEIASKEDEFLELHNKTVVVGLI